MEKTCIVEKDAVVGIDYTLYVDGKVIDSSGDQPLEYLQGHNNIIPGLEKQLEGMTVGEEKEVIVSPAEGYGELNAEGFFNLPRSHFPADYDLRPGMPLRMRTNDGRILTVTVTDVSDEEIGLDMNHPLAGKTLVFKTKIASLRLGTEKEIAQGGLAQNCSGCGSGSSGSCSGCG